MPPGPRRLNGPSATGSATSTACVRPYWALACPPGWRNAASAVSILGIRRVVQLPGHGDCAGRPVAVLAHDQIRLTGSAELFVVGVFPTEQDHHVRILLQRAGFT